MMARMGIVEGRVPLVVDSKKKSHNHRHHNGSLAGPTEMEKERKQDVCGSKDLRRQLSRPAMKPFESIRVHDESELVVETEQKGCRVALSRCA